MNTSDQTKKQLFSLIHDVLLTAKDQEFDGITASRYFYKKYGISIDHHIFTEILDSMTRTGDAVLTQGYGFCKFRIL